jgi:hypothetical protein
MQTAQAEIRSVYVLKGGQQREINRAYHQKKPQHFSRDVFFSATSKHARDKKKKAQSPGIRGCPRASVSLLRVWVTWVVV